MKKMCPPNHVILSILVALVAGFIVGWLWPSEPEVVYVDESHIIDVVNAVSPAVVSITAKNVPKYGILGGEGSGFIISEEGLVVTNRHVVDDPEADYLVILSDGRTFRVNSIEADDIHDLAIVMLDLQENHTNLPTINLGDSDDIQVGQRVIAIGISPDSIGATVSDGVISDNNLSITAGGLQGPEILVNLIQTDASINPGNSGGPLVNLNGKVIGVNSALETTNSRISFAIPSNALNHLLKSIE